ncbi:MAG: 4-hydroxy-3-methylbut-2-enyl diphosphate reductase [SAR202 cluster bacterium]|nr:4-hydroxy-3-methylbut-2-enyl diphosphate reductase [SAR202 cluster bacterium]|tara:strand:+ start:42654 stop:43553 length:900 start_codon:yes stop_codon:yes gene_type:complete
MIVFLGSPRGFCAGVVRAIDSVDIALEKYGPPIYVKHQIVHNSYVVKQIEQKGAITVEKVSEIPEGSKVVFSAHGSAPEDYIEAKTRNLHVLDATCPLVTKVHNEAKKYSKDGRKLILVGHEGHQEVIGTMGQEKMHLIDDRKKNEDTLPSWQKDTPITILTQTTLSEDDTQISISKIQKNFNNVVVKNDICYATTNRQNVVKKLSKMVDIILVIGSANSSNCNRLREVAESYGVVAKLINSPKQISKKWLQNVKNVGITSGASTPEEQIDLVIDFLNPDKVIPIVGANEDISFKMPEI